MQLTYALVWVILVLRTAHSRKQKDKKMGYISSESVKQIRTAVKKEFPQFRFSITREDHSTVRIIITKGPIYFTTNIRSDYARDHVEFNAYHPEQTQDENLRLMFQKISEICSNIDPVKYRETGDYGNQPNYYTTIKLGEYSKPYMKGGA